MTSTEQARTEPTGRRAAGTSEPWGFARVVAVIGGVFFLVGGLWAMVDPEGFYDTLATFEPYNEHFLQDIGAFQLGLGAVLLLAAVWPRLDALAVGLLGVGFGSAAHVVSHAVGHDLGGTPEVDIPFFSVLTGLLIVAGVDRLRRTR
jgi:predicted anti-sigma-YlaC factor YlaD